MSLSREYRIKGPKGHIRLLHFEAHGGAAKRGGILLIHEVFGIDSHFLSLAGRIAAEGFEVFLPDLYTRQPGIYGFRNADMLQGHELTLGPDRQLRFDALSAEDRKRLRPVRDWFERRDTSGFPGDALAGAHWARMKLDGHPLAGWGLSTGGDLVGELAGEAGALDAGIVFYGRIPSAFHAERIRIPMHGHYAENDPQITRHIQGLASILGRNGVDFSHTVHAGASHGFFSPGRPAFQPKAAEKAWKGSLAFLRQRFIAGRFAQGRFSVPDPARAAA